MIEIEIKARASHEHLKKMLSGMGADFIGVENHSDTYYNAPHRDFAQTDEALRIRSVNGRSVLTYKGQKLDTISKTREEFETEVDGTNARSILLALGYFESGNVSKTREIFKYDDITIVLDSVEGLGEFVEVEIVAESDSDISKKRLFDCLEKLRIRQEDTIRTSYLEMLLDL
ncbi:class IV adenylate cyclase [Methanolobus sp. ZRKC3]|uniref:class IV adenylate cyclase n=1 Tax=Methanolobus sp. ZRKC3 TaxID=3125786 RepID=UPI00324C6921